MLSPCGAFVCGLPTTLVAAQRWCSIPVFLLSPVLSPGQHPRPLEEFPWGSQMSIPEALSHVLFRWSWNATRNPG